MMAFFILMRLLCSALIRHLRGKSIIFPWSRWYWSIVWHLSHRRGLQVLSLLATLPQMRPLLALGGQSCFPQSRPRDPSLEPILLFLPTYRLKWMILNLSNSHELTCDVINHKHCFGVPWIGWSYRIDSLTASNIPQLESDGSVSKMHCLTEEINTHAQLRSVKHARWWLACLVLSEG